ncbi:Sarcosine oxidase subunit alpha [Geodia barretti]|uniref:Sarcosine oxidase subunit alpha n=1 Tax=Geodia barretti TaxID=519541 RepID=A0AA35QV01_GEOBA|nr:Sarcosine oxidase subunit alpha [Geodia barretti]
MPEPAGLLLDRTEPIAFRFEGKQYQGYRGDTVASALAANDVSVLSRSFKYHRPRGIHSLSGLDANTLVQVGPAPNRFADREPLSPDLDVMGQNYWGTLRHDRLAVFGLLHRFFPVGFYYKAFYKPRWTWPLWAKMIRRIAGLGTVDTNTPHGYFDKQYLFCDVLVVGGGAAGLAAAAQAAAAGADVVLVDENAALGGGLLYGRPDAGGIRAEEERARLVGAVEGSDRISAMTETACLGWYADNWLPLVRGNRLYKLRAKTLVVATGSLEQPLVFRNNDLPGVMLSGAAQRLIKLYGVKPGRRAVVATVNDEGYGAALDLLDAGVEVAAVVDLRMDAQRSALGDTLAARRVPVHAGAAPWEAVPQRKGPRLARVRVARIEADGVCAPSVDSFTCDLLVVCGGHAPAAALLRQAGATFAHDSTSAVWPIFPHPDHKAFVDLDEDVQVHDLEDAIAEGYDHVELLKRFTTNGMGPSQGRHSSLNAARVLARATARSVDETGVTTMRQPIVPVTMGHLAGRSFEPVRYTAMHFRHLEAGATMMPAGLWLRPEFYGDKARRQALIREETKNVRDNVGIVDVSTLGGLDVRGPDAAEFMNRMYTFAYLKQPVGRSRYVLMTDLSGVVVDDGVACRLHEDHFYVTATTSGVDNVYREMLWYNAQWRLKVDVTNVTAAFAGVNIAGPNCRAVLETLCDDVDISPEGFPYMGVREGHVAGIPALFLRVGFVGELGYELHVPASQGEALWDALLDAGKEHGIRPFGVEAQRLLRLEKGHIIIGQDTDGLTTPHEADMAWALAKKKPFHVGIRSVRMQAAKGLTRKLVGFEMPGVGVEQPKECHLVIRGREITGRVTSVAYSPNLDKVIGLAYVAPDQSEPGQSIEIRVDGGRMVNATVAKLPFFDPDGARQEL